jgi:uncharacterized membrane protein
MADNESENVEKLEDLKWILRGAIGLLILALFAYFLYFSNLLFPDGSDQHAVWGTFGDFMGGTLNPIFALFSLYAIIVTIKVQAKELELTRKAMNESNTAQQEQSDSFRKQNISVKLQTFENTFFKLLEHHNGLIEKLTIKDGQIHKILQNTEFEVVDLFNKNNKCDIKKYFMTLYQILKFVSDQEENFKGETYFNPKLYTNIIRASFDDNLLVFLAINCTINGFDEYKKLVEKYELFEHLDITVFRENELGWVKSEQCSRDTFTYRIIDVLDQYDSKAFGKNVELKALITNPPIVKPYSPEPI